MERVDRGGYFVALDMSSTYAEMCRVPPSLTEILLLDTEKMGGD